MALWTNLGAGARGLTAGAGIIVLAVASYVVFERLSRPADVTGERPQVADHDLTVLAPEVTADAQLDLGQSHELAPATAPQPPESADQAAAPDPGSAPVEPMVGDGPAGPRFDLVRVDPEGGAVVAGRTAPQGEIRVMIDGSEAARAQADAGGSFVAMFDLPASAQPRMLTLELLSSNGDVLGSDDSVVLGPTPGQRVAAVADGVAEGMAETAAPDALQAPDAPDLVAADPTLTGDAAASIPDDAAPVAPAQSPAVLLAGEQGVRVVQSGGAAPAPEVMDNVMIDTIAYSPAGTVQLSGRARGEGTVQLYLDNQPLATVAIGADGGWDSELPQIDTGVYTLRADELAATGEVVSRFETPFQREDPALLAGLSQDNENDPSPRAEIVTVQPGYTLWGISRQTYGRGILYVQVFEANRDLIRDPDLIYPGQVFSLPELGQEAEHASP